MLEYRKFYRNTVDGKMHKERRSQISKTMFSLNQLELKMPVIFVK